jgi:hypothetical protein
VKCRNVQPYLDRYKVTLKIGNPLSATYDGSKATARWGAKPPEAPKSASEWDAVLNWEKSLKTRQFSFTNKLLPGWWNEVEIVLPQTAPNEMRYLSVSLDMDTLSLLLPRQEPTDR